MPAPGGTFPIQPLTDQTGLLTAGQTGSFPLQALEQVRREVLPGHDHPASLACGGGGVQRKLCGARSAPKEREPRWPRYEPAGAPDRRESGLASPFLQGRAALSFVTRDVWMPRFVATWPIVLPLLWGEGRGGNWAHAVSTVPGVPAPSGCHTFRQDRHSVPKDLALTLHDLVLPKGHILHPQPHAFHQPHVRNE